MDHQAAIVLYFGPPVNYIPVMDPTGKRKLAYIAHGKEALQDLRHCRRIPIQAWSAGRRKGAKRGKGAMIAGRPSKSC